MPPSANTVLIVFFSMMILFMVIMFAVIGHYGSIWFRAYMSGVPIRLLDIIGMKFRRTDTKAVVRALIMAKHAGAAVSCTDMEKAYLQGVDLEKVTLAFIEAKKQGLEISFNELVDAERQDRLAEKLKRVLPNA